MLLVKTSLQRLQSVRPSLVLIVLFGACAVVIAGCGSSAASAQPAPAATAEDISSSAACLENQTVSEEPPEAAGSSPFGLGPWYVNVDRTIWVGWGSGPPWVKGLNKKVMWLKPPVTTLKISGRRLDADAGPLISRQFGGYDSFGYEPTNLTFPTGGCWEVTGEAGDASITFVTLVRG